MIFCDDCPVLSLWVRSGLNELAVQTYKTPYADQFNISCLDTDTLGRMGHPRALIQ